MPLLYPQQRVQAFLDLPLISFKSSDAFRLRLARTRLVRVRLPPGNEKRRRKWSRHSRIK